EAVNVLLHKGANASAPGGHYGKDNVFYAASSAGHEAVMETLIDKGANVNAKGGQYGKDNMLQTAFSAGQ
ncbi:hypothetical protein EJ04DRAFT_435725, partial [Polyplosphaeria fusca]